MTSLTRSAWSENATFWINIIRSGADRYRTELTDAAVLQALQPLTGMDLLDVGCGEGYLAREAERRGARSTGIDICPELVAAAAEEGTRLGLLGRYEEADLRDLPFADAAFDVVVANHSLNEVEDHQSALREWARVLRPGGLAVILMLHPCFFTWDPSEPGQPTYGPRAGAKPYKVGGVSSPAVATAHVATLTSYVQAIGDAGFVIEDLSEPMPTPAQVAGDNWWAQRAEVPKFLLVTARRT